MSPKLTLYQQLGVRPGADDLAMRRAFKLLMRLYDPARPQQRPDALDAQRQVREAYDVLSDPQRRAEYDEFGEQALEPGFNAREARARIEREREAEKRRIKAALIAPTAIALGAPGAPHEWSIQVAIGPGAAKSGRVIKVPVTRPIECPRCAGSGRRDKTCPRCGGEKQLAFLRGEACAACHGVGLFAQDRLRCRKCKGRGRRGKSLCARCGGCGQEVRRADCQVCAGRGLRVNRVVEPCRGCDATGLVACSRCGGAKTIPKRLSLRLRVPRRAQEGLEYRYAGAGFDRGGEPGDLRVQFTILARAPRR